MFGEPQLRFGGVAEYVHLKLDAGGGDDLKPDGYGLHGRVEFAPISAATLYTQLGYVHVSDHGTADGFEWQIGAAYNFTPMFGAFVDYRATDLDADDVDYKLNDVRLGMRRSGEHTYGLKSLMRISSAVFCLQKKNQHTNISSY